MKRLTRILCAALAALTLGGTLAACAPASTQTQAEPAATATPAPAATATPAPTAEPAAEATPQPDAAQQPETPPATEAPAATPAPEAAPASDEQIIADRLAGMTLREKVGQLFFVRPDSLDLAQTQEQINDANTDGATALTDAMAATLADYPVGGVVLFGKNITGQQQLDDFVGQLHAALATPMLVGIDEEGGLVARLANHPAFDLPKYESAAAVAAQGADAVREMSTTIGNYLNTFNIDLDFAPDADVNTNPNNPVIGTRAFASDPQTAAEMVTAAVEGFAATDTLCCIKHYPGHGDTAEDSHKSLAVTHKTWDELQACELLPFQAGIQAGVDLVMVGHIAAPEVTGNDLPASLSPQLVGTLRSELGYTGAIITDSMAMEGITDQHLAGEAAVLAIQAGIDILLMPNGLTEAFDAVVAAVEDGTIPESRIEESAARVLALKLKRGLI